MALTFNLSGSEVNRTPLSIDNATGEITLQVNLWTNIEGAPVGKFEQADKTEIKWQPSTTPVSDENTTPTYAAIGVWTDELVNERVTTIINQ